MDDNRDLDSELGDLVRKLEHLTPNPELKTDLAKLLWKYGHRISVLEAQVAYLADKLDQLEANNRGSQSD